MDEVQSVGDTAVSERSELDQLVALVEQLRTALASRDVIGQAKGVLMERHRIDAQEAFDRLVRESQERNVKLRDIAQAMVEARTAEP
jgi:AmiR/NasT family two-component response regulator